MTGTFCTHFAISHQEPKREADCYDNVTLMLEHIEALFDSLAIREEGGHSGSLAILGGELCEELRRRLHVMYEWQDAADSQQQKEA